VFGFRVVGVILLLVLCVVALSAVFDGGLNGAGATRIPAFRLPFPNESAGGTLNSLFNYSSRVGYTRPNVSLTPPYGEALSPGGGMVLPGWLGLALLLAVGLGGLFVLFFRGNRAGVYDLSGAISLLEESSRRFSSSYGAAKLGALAEYYRRLRDLCVKLGIREQAWEAPTEFLDRVAQSMGLDRVEARRFAEVFGRSRYSSGLSVEEEEALSHFMSHFLEAVRRRIELGVKQ